MTRLEELTMNLADDRLTDREARELQVLLAQSEGGHEEHIQILQIEAGLRASGRSLDLADSIMARLRRELGDSVAEGVMSEIRAKPAADWQRRERGAEKGSAGQVGRVLSFPVPGRGNRWAPKPALLALAACVVLAIGLGIWYFGPTMGEPVLADVQGAGLVLERVGEPILVSRGARLWPGDVLRVSRNGSASISYAPENTQLTIHPGTDLKLSSGLRGKSFILSAGKIEAGVARQRPFHQMVVRTPDGEAQVLGTRFTLSCSTSNGTRLEVIQGEVRFTRLSDDTTVRVRAGNYAVAATNYELAPQPLTGVILREIWTNVPGASWTDLLTHPNYPNRPDGWGLTNLASLEMPSNWADNYGQRLCGYVHPPKTGEYTIWLAAKDSASLYLSPDERPENKVHMANSVGAASRDWLGHAAHQASGVSLTAGKRYYFEVVHKAAAGDDHLAVAWQPPGGNREIIPGDCLSPFKIDGKERKP